MRAVGIVVMRVRRTVTPVTRVVISCFQTTLRRRFPFIVGLDLDALLLAPTVLVLIGRVRAFDLRIVGQHIETEMVIRSADVQLMLVHLELVVEGRVTARMIACAVLVAGIGAVIGAIDDVRVGIGTMVVIAHREYFRIAHHAKSRYADRMAFCDMKIKTAAGEHTAAFMRLRTLLHKVTRDQTRVQHMATRSTQVIAVRRATSVARMIAIAHIEIAVHRPGIEIDVKAHIGARRGRPGFCQSVVNTSLNRTVITGSAVFFHHEVDDAGRSFGAVLRGRVGDQLDLLDRTCRHLL